MERACATSSRMCVRGRCAVMMINYSCLRRAKEPGARKPAPRETRPLCRDPNASAGSSGSSKASWGGRSGALLGVTPIIDSPTNHQKPPGAPGAGALHCFPLRFRKFICLNLKNGRPCLFVPPSFEILTRSKKPCSSCSSTPAQRTSQRALAAVIENRRRMPSKPRASSLSRQRALARPAIQPGTGIRSSRVAGPFATTHRNGGGLARPSSRRQLVGRLPS